MGKLRFPMLNTLLLDSQPSRSIKHIFWRRYRGTSRRIAHKKVFIANLCKRLSLGRLHLGDYHLVLLDFAKYFIFVLLVLHIIILLFSVLHYFYFSIFIFIFCFAFLFTIYVSVCISIILLSVFILKTKNS
jgi:hypothetical protein